MALADLSLFLTVMRDFGEEPTLTLPWLGGTLAELSYRP